MATSRPTAKLTAPAADSATRGRGRELPVVAEGGVAGLAAVETDDQPRFEMPLLPPSTPETPRPVPFGQGERPAASSKSP